MTDGDALERMRADWDRRAEEDAHFFIASGAATSDAAFRASGVRDVEDAVLDGITLAPSASVLEIGCGIGRLLAPLAPRVASACGVDISPVMIAKSKSFTAGLPNVKTWVTDGTLAPLEDARLDFVFSYIVFQHIPDRAPVRRYVEEAARVLRPGGLFRFQVDGRWRRREARGAATYDGVKFSPEGVHDLLAGTGLTAVDEWGAETHYHWVTARREGPATAGATFRPRAWDIALLEETLVRCGSADATAEARRVVAGETSLRRAVAGADAAIGAWEHGEFVRDAWVRLFGAPPREPHLAELVDLLERNVESREDLVDILLTRAELRDALRPRAAAIPWPRLLSLGLRPAEEFFVAVAAAERLVAVGDADTAIETAFRTILGQRPDDDALAHYRRAVDGEVRGRRLLVRALLAAKAADPPRPPDEARVSALLARHGVAAPAEARAGESFPGEADVAGHLLASAGREDAAFVRDAYRGVLGREADAGGAAWYEGRLASGHLNRAGLLRELLWSGELRGE